MDYVVTKSFIWNLKNYFQINGLTNENLQARFVSALFIKSDAVWKCNRMII